MTNLLNTALNQDYRNVPVVKSVMPKTHIIPKTDVKKEFLKKDNKNQKKLLLTFAGLAVLSVAAIIRSDVKEAKKLTQEGIELAEKSKILMEGVDKIKHNSRLVFKNATDIVNETIEALKLKTKVEELSIPENVQTKIKVLEREGNIYFANFTKKADDILIDSIEIQKRDNLLDMIFCDKNNAVNTVFSDMKQYENLFGAIPIIHLYKNSKLKLVALNVIKEEKNLKIPRLYNFNNDECVNIAENCYTDLKGTISQGGTLFSYENGIISECLKGFVKNKENSKEIADYRFVYENGILKNFENEFKNKFDCFSDDVNYSIMAIWDSFWDLFTK